MHDSEAPAAHQQVITATAFIHHIFNGVEKVLLAKRSPSKKFLPGFYELPGGHITFGEDIVSGLKREIMEELSLPITVGEPFFVFTYMNTVKGSHSIEVVYFAESTNIQRLKTNANDHSIAEWFDDLEAEKILQKERKAHDPELLAVKKGFFLLRRRV